MYGRRGAAPENTPVCRFWKSGSCRYGKDCKFKHEDDSGSANNGNNNTWSNNNTNANNNSASNNFRNNNRLNKHNPFLLDRDAIKADLTPGEERPEWPLSAYGPGRDAPLQLMHGKYEVSPEEMRVECYLARANGRFDEYLDRQNRSYTEVMAEGANIVRNVDEAIKHVSEGETRDGNRRAQVTQNSGDFPKMQPGFGQPSQVAQPTGLSTFGHTSHANQNPAFPSQSGSQGGFPQPQQTPLGGRPAFGQPTSIGSAAFGQPSQPSQNSFGQPSQPSQSAFGRPSQPAFGQPSQPSQPAFGQPSQPKPPGFGQPSQINQPAFGQPSQPVQPAFGQPSQPTQPAFGQPSQPNHPAFGQPSQPAQPAFGQPSQPAQSTFGRPSQPSSPFGASNPQNPQSTGSGFSSIKPSPFSSTPNGATQARPQSQQAAPSQQQVPQPAGPISHPGADPDAEGPPSAYEGQLGKALKDVYQAVYETGRFGGDLIPEIPPKREWIRFDA